jgi:hypothetical protein
MSINIPTAYKTKIDIPFGQLKDIVKWCEDNLVGDWKFTEDHNYPYHPYNNYIFLFELERDYVAFNIWKK